MINVLICGINGKMGANVCGLLATDGEAQVVCGVDISTAELPVPVYSSFTDVREGVDVVIDFSSPATLYDELEWAKTKHVPVILAATGHTSDDLKYIESCSKDIAIFKSANFSVGINLLVKLVRETAEALGESFDIEIVEKHHHLKADAPGGTALMLADGANTAFENKKDYMNGREGIVGRRGREIGLHAVRGGTIVGEHEVIFAGEDEIITLSHSARSKKVFASGAVKAAKWIVGKPAGRYDMADLLKTI